MKSLSNVAAAWVALAVTGFVSRGAPGSAAASPDSLAWIHEFRVDTVFVERKAITVREIVRRATRGERTKLAGHDNMTLTITTRQIAEWKEKRIVTDNVYRVYVDVRGNYRRVHLGEDTREYKKTGGGWAPAKDDGAPKVRERIEFKGYEDFQDLPFYLEDVSDYDFTLLGRTLDGDHVVFKIGFRPRSDFDALPSGVVYIDTPDYQVIHEEFSFANNPAPLFLEGIRRVSRQWTELPTGEWVYTRVTADIALRHLPFFPAEVSFTVLRGDFRFDGGYDARVFGEMPGAAPSVRRAPSRTPPVPAAGRPPEAPGAAGAPDEPDEPEDATGIPDEAPAGRSLLETLHREDDAFFPRELLDVNETFRDSSVALHDSLGLERYRRRRGTGTARFKLGVRLAQHLADYNRVEGDVGGLGVVARLGRYRAAEVRFEGAYASGPGVFRHYESLDVPLLRSAMWRLGVSADWSERVVPYGTNRPVWNGLRAFAGGADERDYLEREGGGAGLTLRHRRGFEIGALFETARERSVAATEDFSLAGDLARFNAPVRGGTDRAVALRMAWAPRGPSKFRAAVEGRVAGGALGGDFEYTRADASLRWRRRLVGRHAAVLTLRGAALAGNPPVQRRADLGGLGTVRGYDRRSRVGEASLFGRLEYPLPYDVLERLRVPLLRLVRLQPVAWADAGRVWRGNADSAVYSFGAGVQLYLGPFGRVSNLRLDVAFPRGAGRADDVRYILHFTR